MPAVRELWKWQPAHSQEAAALQVPGMLVPAAATREPVRPAVLEERPPAVLLGGVHLHELDQGLRMSHHLRLLVGRYPGGYTRDRTEGDGHVQPFLHSRPGFRMGHRLAGVCLLSLNATDLSAGPYLVTTGPLRERAASVDPARLQS